MLKLVKVLRGNMCLSCAGGDDGFGAGSVPGRVVTVDLIASLMPGAAKASAGSRRYLLPPPLPG